MSEEQKKLLEAQLWSIANVLRGKMDADDFRDYILGFIFYKYLSEKMLLYANEILQADNIKYDEIDENTEQGKLYLEAIRDEAVTNLGYFLTPNELFHKLAQKGLSRGEEEDGNFILKDLKRVLKDIETSTLGTESEDDFNQLFEDIDLESSKLGKQPAARNYIIVKILNILNEIDFKLDEIEADVLGDAYEYLIAQFASGAGKKAGEFYTPAQVSKLLAKIVTIGKTEIRTAYDPTCGSGSLLLRINKEVKVGQFYGQELNRTTYNLTRMNMILHGVNYTCFDIKQEDTLEKPQHLDKRFEAVVANPPFSANWSARSTFLNDDRFSQYGVLAPSTKADFAFVQHMIYQLADNGTMAIVLPHGVLFRGGAEGNIRKYIINDLNYLDAVIGLPANLFYGTGIPTSILVLKKCRVENSTIMFINASQEYEKIKTQNMLRNQDIEKIIDTYKNRIEIEKYSRNVTIEEIKENEYNLNIPRYINTYEEEENIDLEETVNNIKGIEEEINKVEISIKEMCRELNINEPF